MFVKKQISRCGIATVCTRTPTPRSLHNIIKTVVSYVYSVNYTKDQLVTERYTIMFLPSQMAALTNSSSRFTFVHFPPVPPIRVRTTEPLVAILARHHQAEEMRPAYMLDQALYADQRTIGPCPQTPRLDVDLRLTQWRVWMSNMDIPPPIASLNTAPRHFLHLPPLFPQHRLVPLAFVPIRIRTGNFAPPSAVCLAFA